MIGNETNRTIISGYEVKSFDYNLRIDHQHDITRQDDAVETSPVVGTSVASEEPHDCCRNDSDKYRENECRDNQQKGYRQMYVFQHARLLEIIGAVQAHV